MPLRFEVMRAWYLGDHRPALTVVCCQLLDPKWKLEIEAMAAGQATFLPAAVTSG